MKILFLSRWFPYPANNGSKLRVYHLLRGLTQAHDVVLLSFCEPGEDVQTGMPVLQAMCKAVHTVTWKPFNPNGTAAKLAFFSPKPRSVIDTFSPEMAASVQRLAAEHAFDLVIASQVGTAEYARFWGDIPAIFEEVELGVFYEKYTKATTSAARLRHGLMWWKQKNYLRQTLAHFQACTVVSDVEKGLVETAVGPHHRVEVIPNCMHLPDYQLPHVQKQPNTLVYTGSFTYFANHEAMVWFLEHVYPLVKTAVPDTTLTITGDHANLPLPPADDVTLTGFVDDIRPVIASAAISLAPIHTGGGTRLKILEAMALRTPVVSTTKGAEGLDVVDGVHLLLADTPEDFAQAVIRLLGDAALRQRLAENGYRLVAEKYDWTAVTPRFLQLAAQTAVSGEKQPA